MAKTTEQTLLPPAPDPRALNGVRHGMTSDLVPLWEREAYAAHVRAVRESAGAVGYLQERLADRAALALWRLDRVARWEAAELERDRQRCLDRLRSPALPAFSIPGVRPPPVDALGLQDSLEALSKMTGETVEVLLRDPDTAELVAQGYDLKAALWAALSTGDEVGEVSREAAMEAGVDLLSALTETWDADPRRLARLMLSRTPTAAEAQSVADWDWTVEPQELPVLVREAVRLAGRGAWIAWLQEQRYAATTEAARVRAVAARLPDLLRLELERTTEPDIKRVEKITRYEGHLERVLYRSLGELRDLQSGEGADTLSGPAPADS